MSGSNIFFLAFSAIIALVGLLAAGLSRDYLQVFGLGLFLFGVLFAYGCIKRHFDAVQAAKH